MIGNERIGKKVGKKQAKAFQYGYELRKEATYRMSSEDAVAAPCYAHGRAITNQRCN